jgi:hypothetical protein
MQTVINARVELEADLRRSLQSHGFTLNYQRQTASSGHTVGAEALLRWQRPSSQQVSPSVFIPLAEETGPILQLGEWVLEAACRQLVSWGSRPETAHLTMAINVSARTILGLGHTLGLEGSRKASKRRTSGTFSPCTDAVRSRVTCSGGRSRRSSSEKLPFRRPYTSQSGNADPARGSAQGWDAASCGRISLPISSSTSLALRAPYLKLRMT